jgi:DNA polymerase-3 subunit gamma/tau
MTYQVLARKWRPKSFASLVGQEHVVRALTHALDGGRLHHAYLFTGTRGVGKTTLSRIFAKALNCETGVTSTPCGVCRACREIDEGRFVDYVEMDAASNRGVDEMAALLERAVYAPVDARFKVYMIDEVHMLTNHAFNAMLKTLEEPPAHVKFILATTDPQKIPVTVLSRCLQFNLKQMPAGHIVTHLEHVLGEERIPFEPQALRLLSRAADGSMRDALSLTDQAIAYSANQVTEEAVRGMLGALDQSYLIRMLDALAAGDGPDVLAIADEMALRSLSFSTALQDLAGLLHRIAWAQFAPSSVLDEWPEATDIRRFADALGAEQVQLFYQIATIGRAELGLAPDEYAGFTMTLLRMLAFEPAGGPGGGGANVRVPVAGAGTRAAVPAGIAAKGGGVSAASDGGVPGSGRVSSASVKSDATITLASPTPDRVADDAAQPVFAPKPETVASNARNAAGSGTESPVGGTEESVTSDTAQSPSTSDDETEAQPEAGVSVNSGAEPSLLIDEGNAAVSESEPLGSIQRGVIQTDTLRSNLSGEESDALSSDSSIRATSDDTGLSAPAEVVDQVVAEASAARVLQPSTEGSEGTVTPPAATEQPEEKANGNGAATPAEPIAGVRAPSGASAALDVLRSAGMRVSSDRPGRAPQTARKPVSSNPPVQVPVPRRPAASRSESNAAEAAPKTSAAAASSGGSEGSPVPPWEDMPPDDYPSSSADDDYFMPPDDGFVPAFESGPDDLRFQESSSAKPSSSPSPSPKTDTRPLPPAVPLDAIGVAGDWPALAVGLPLKGIAHQLAFNSELTACDAACVTLVVPVPQYAETAQVAKLKAALAEKLGRTLDVIVSVGPARRTAAALDAAARAKRQQQAEQEITQDPFVQSLIREFGGSIVQDSIKPLAPDASGHGNTASPS